MASLTQRIFQKGEYKIFGKITADIYLYFLTLGIYIVLLVFNFLKRNRSQNLISVFYLSLLTILPFKFFRLIVPTILLAALQLVILIKQTMKFFNGKETAFYRITYSILIIVIVASILGVKPAPNRQAPYPYKAQKFVKDYLASKRLFTSVSWNDYFIWSIPNIQTFADVMHFYRSQESFDDEAKLHNPSENPQFLLEKYAIDTVVNSYRITLGSTTPVYKIPKWQLVFVDNSFAVYARKNIIESLPIDLSAIQMELETTLKFRAENKKQALKQLNGLKEFDPENGFARYQLIIYYLSYERNINEALNLAMESRKLLPQDPWYSYFLAAAYAQLNKCTEANNFAKEAIYKSHNDPEIKSYLASSQTACANLIN